MRMRVLCMGAPPCLGSFHPSLWDTRRRMVMVTYHRSHWAPQPRLPLQTMERERASPLASPAPVPWGFAPHSCQEPTFSPFTLAVTTVPSGLMMTPGSPFSPCKRRGDGRGHGGIRLLPVTGLVSPGGQVESGTRNVTPPWNAGGLEQLPSTLGHPGDQLTPGLLLVPPDPAGRIQRPRHSQPTKGSPQTPPPSLPLCSKAQQDWQPQLSPGPPRGP